MGLLSFWKKSGEEIVRPEETAAAGDSRAKLDEIRAKAMEKKIAANGFEVADLDIDVDDDTVTVRGAAADQATREKVVLVLGNISGVGGVDDQMTVAGAEAAGDDEAEDASGATFYTVQAGDSLSKIAKAQYGNAMKYPVIFEANKPMLTDPDKIYPGQVLRIPALDA